MSSGKRYTAAAPSLVVLLGTAACVTVPGGGFASGPGPMMGRGFGPHLAQPTQIAHVYRRGPVLGATAPRIHAGNTFTRSLLSAPSILRFQDAVPEDLFMRAALDLDESSALWTTDRADVRAYGVPAMSVGLVKSALRGELQATPELTEALFQRAEELSWRRPQAGLLLRLRTPWQKKRVQLSHW